MIVNVGVSVGEWLDKLTIVEIKLAEIGDPAKRANLARERAALERAAPAGLDGVRVIGALRAQLKAVNQQLWRIEDDIREHERERRFDARFISLARSVYITNDRRAELKREINRLSGSLLVEEKSYAAY